MARSAASRLVRAARAAAAATARRQGPGAGREVLPRALAAPLAGDASAFAAATGEIRLCAGGEGHGRVALPGRARGSRR